jgi:hypothetical protein
LLGTHRLGHDHHGIGAGVEKSITLLDHTAERTVALNVRGYSYLWTVIADDVQMAFER